MGRKIPVAHKKILLIQNDVAEAKAVSEAPQASFRVDWVRHCSEGVERLARGGKREEQAAAQVGFVSAPVANAA